MTTVTDSILATLNAKIADVAGFASSLTAPADQQAALDAANAQVATLTAQLAAVNATLAAEQTLDAALLAKIQKAQSDLA